MVNIIYIKFLEINFEIIFCKNNNLIFHNKITCYSANHIILFISSLIITLIEFFICFIGVSIIFSNEEKIMKGTVKHFISNPEKIIFIVKTMMLLILAINKIIKMNNLMIPLISFISGMIIFYSFFLEYYYHKSNDFRQLFNYSLSLIYFCSGLFIFIGYIIKDKDKKGYFFYFILFCLIFLFLLNNFIYNNKIINFKSLQKLNEFETFFLINNILISIKQKSNDRELMLNYLQYNHYHSNNNEFEEEFIEENNKNYNFYCKIEKALKGKIIMYNSCLLLKILHFIILNNYLLNYKNAYLLLYQLYYDLENNYINANIEQQFFIYRIKKSIEDDSIEFNLKKDDISIRYQINFLIDLINTVTELYYSFWNLLLISYKNKDITRINKIGTIIHKLINEIEYKFQEIKNIKYRDKKIILLYGLYLRDIINDNEKAENYLNIQLNEEKIIENKEKSINDYISSSKFQFLLISLNKKNLGKIEKISTEFSIKLGYLPKELIGQDIKILFPSLFNEEIKKLLEDINIYHYKGIKKFFYLKTKSKYIELFPIETFLKHDEEYNNFLLFKLDVNQLIDKKRTNECHIITDNKLIINLFSSNSIYLLNLTSNFIGNSSFDISMLITEFNDEITNILSKQIFESFEINSIKYSILKNKFINKEIKINWSLNNHLFKMITEEIKFNNKLIGFFFHFISLYKNKKKKNTNLLQDISLLRKELFINSEKKYPLLRAKTRKKQTNEIIKNSLIIEKINIDDNFIPDNEKEINYFPKAKNYFFNSNYNDTIKNYFESYKKNIFKEDINKTEDKSHSFSSSSIITKSEDSKEDEFEYSSYIDSEFKNIEETKINVYKDNFKKKLSLIENNEEDNYYKINFKHIHFYIYNFQKNIFDEIQNFELKTKLEKLILEEKNKTISKKNTKSRLSKINTYQNTREKNEEIKEKKKEVKSSKFISLNIYIIIWIFILLLYSFSLIFIIIIYFQYCLLLRKKMVASVNIHNSLSDLMQNGNIVFYFAYQLIVIQNSLYINSISRKKELEKEAITELITLFTHQYQVVEDINIYATSISKTNKYKIENYSINLISLNNNLEINITQSKVINTIKEFSFATYSIIHLNNEKMHFIQKDFNFILANYETLLIEGLNEFSDIFIDEFNNLRKYLYLITLICFCIFCFIVIMGFYLQIKIMNKIIKEQEKITDIFFKINPKYIINAIKNCEYFIELNTKDKNNPKHLVSNPEIQISEKEIKELHFPFNELQTNNLIYNRINNKTKSYMKQKTFFKCDMKRIDKNYLMYLLISIIIFIIIFFFIMIYQINKYKYIYDLSQIYFRILSHRTYVVKYYNYIKTIICYYAHKETNKIIKNVYYHLQTSLKLSLSINQEMFNKVFNLLKNLNKDEIKIFNEIMFGDICSYIQEYSDLNNITCNEIGDGIAHYGYYSSNIYAFQLMIYLKNELEDIIIQGEKKGFKYDEIYYKSDNINDLYPKDKNLWNEYKSLNPFLLLNNNNSLYLTLIIQQITRKSLSGLRDKLRNKMVNIVNKIKNNIILSVFGFLFIFIFITIFILLPKIIIKNNEIIEEKNMLKIIPKNELKQILIQDDIK